MAKSQRSSAYRFGLNIGHVITRIFLGLVITPLVFGLGDFLIRNGVVVFPQADIAFNTIAYVFLLYFLIPLMAIFMAWLLLTAIYAVCNFPLLIVDTDGVTLKSTFQNGKWDWEDLTKFVDKTQPVETYTQYGTQIVYFTAGAYRVYSKAKHVFAISGFFRRFKQAAELVESHIAYMHLSDTLDALKAGKKVHFGKVTLSRGGVSEGKKTVEWKQFRIYRTNDIALLLEHAGGEWRIPLDKIENRKLFFHVLDMVIHKQRIAPPVFFTESGA